MSTFSGPQGKGAAKRHATTKRAVAEARNEAAHAVNCMACGHVHGTGRGCPR